MPGTGWPLASQPYKEFNISECKERLYRTHPGVECGLFMWDLAAFGGRQDTTVRCL